MDIPLHQQHQQAPPAAEEAAAAAPRRRLRRLLLPHSQLIRSVCFAPLWPSMLARYLKVVFGSGLRCGDTKFPLREGLCILRPCSLVAYEDMNTERGCLLRRRALQSCISPLCWISAATAPKSTKAAMCDGISSDESSRTAVQPYIPTSLLEFCCHTGPKRMYCWKMAARTASTKKHSKNRCRDMVKLSSNAAAEEHSSLVVSR